MSLFEFQLLGECHCLWTSVSPRAHAVKFVGRFRLIGSVWRASKFSVFKLIEIVILWVYYTIPFGFSLFWHFLSLLFNFLIQHVWLTLSLPTSPIGDVIADCQRRRSATLTTSPTLFLFSALQTFCYPQSSFRFDKSNLEYL